MTPNEIMKEILKRKIELEKLKRKLDLYSKIPPKPEFEYAGEAVHFVPTQLDETVKIFYSEVQDIDFNMFHTEKYAKRLMLAAKMIAMQLHCKWYIDRDFVPDWNDARQHKYTVYYNHVVKKFCVACWETHERPDVAFSTRQAAELCAEWLQENWKDYNYD